MANKDNNYGVPKLNSFQVIEGQGFYAPEHCDPDLWPTDLKIKRDHLWAMAITRLLTPVGWTNGQTDDMRHHIIWYL